MSLGQGELSVIKGCLYMGVGIVQSLVSLRPRELSIIEVFVLWRCLQGEVQLYHHQGIT